MWDDSLVQKYNIIVASLLDKAISNGLQSNENVNTSRGSTESGATRCKVHILEPLFNSKGTPEAWTTWRTDRRSSRKSSHSKAASYWRAKIATSGNDNKSVNYRFRQLITTNIGDICKGTDSACALSYAVHGTSNLNQFKTVDVDFVTKMIGESPTGQGHFDSNPTRLVNDFVSLLMLYITRGVNHSVVAVRFSFHWKYEIFYQIIKKSVWPRWHHSVQLSTGFQLTVPFYSFYDLKLILGRTKIYQILHILFYFSGI